MTTYEILSKWEDLKEGIIDRSKKYNKDLSDALSAFGLNREEIEESVLAAKEKLVNLEYLWDARVDAFTDLVEEEKVPRGTNIEELLDNFAKSFFNELSKVFPPKNVIELPETFDKFKKEDLDKYEDIDAIYEPTEIWPKEVSSKIAEDEDKTKYVVKQIERKSPKIPEELVKVAPFNKVIKSLVNKIEEKKSVFDKAEGELEDLHNELKKIARELSLPEKEETFNKAKSALSIDMEGLTKVLYSLNTSENQSNRAVTMGHKLFVVVEEKKEVLPKETVDDFINFIKDNDKKLSISLAKLVKAYRNHIEDSKEVIKTVTGYYWDKKTSEEFSIIDNIKDMFSSLKETLLASDEVLKNIMELNNEITELEEKLRAAV